MKLITLTSLFFACNAWGAGYQLRYQGAETMGTSFASQGTYGNSVSNIYYNPALFLKQDKKQAVAIEGMVVIPYTAEFTSDASGKTFDEFADTGFSGALYYAYKINDSTAVTLAVTTPWGTNTDYTSNWEGQYAALKTQLKAFNFQPVVSKAITDSLAVSVGPQIQSIKGVISKRIPPKIGPDKALNDLVGNQVFELDGDDIGFGAVVAVTYTPNDHLTLNLTYNSQIKHKLEGDATISSTPGLSSSASAELFTPDILNLGVSHVYNDTWTSHLALSYTNWSLFKSFDIEVAPGKPMKGEVPFDPPASPQNWKDTYFVALGATYNANDQWSFRGGASYETSAVDNKDRTPRTQDSDRLGLGVGGSFKASDSLSLDFGYNQVIYLGDIKLVNDGTNPMNANPNGKYDNAIGLLRVGLEYNF